MLVRPGRSALFLQRWIVAWALLGTACDSDFGTDWARDAAVDLEAGPDLDAGLAEAGSFEAGSFEAGDPDAAAIPVLPRFDCAGLFGDAGLDAGLGCELDCVVICSALCRDAGTCGDADVWTSCAHCGEGGIPPPP
jgi:hypothetical protein